MNPIQEQELRAYIRKVCEGVQPNSNTSLNGIILASLNTLMKEKTNFFEDVCDFHHKFNRMYLGGPRMLPELEEQHRLQTLKEEVMEYEEAQHLSDKLDALVDLIYFALGTAHLHGFQRFEEAWKRVHQKNMEKELSTTENPGKRSIDGKQYIGIDIVKPKGWTPPDLTDLVR
jgi:predicted HAD superfamily Cof-like phosphohydrolase